MNDPVRPVFVGTGAVACALAAAWRDGGGAPAWIVSRDPARAASAAAACGATGTADLREVPRGAVIVVCVPDRFVAESGVRVAETLGGSSPLVFHTSGALPGAALTPRANPPALRTGSLHPLQSFPSALLGSPGERVLAARVAGTHWFHEGDGADVARSMTAVWRGEFHALSPGGKALYHAGAAIVSNHTVALFADATRLLATAGVPAAESRAALASLLAGTAANLADRGVPDSLTGPVARGDASTVRRHVEAIAATAPELLDAYRAMARRAIVVALERRSIDAAGAAALESALTAAG